MLTATTLNGMMLAGSLLTMFAAIGSRVLRDFSHHDLENLCRARRPDRFDEILLHHLRAALVADSFLALGVTLWVFAAGARFSLLATATQPAPDVRSFFLSVAGASLILLVITTWVPLAIARIWGANVVFHTWRIWRFASLLALPLTAVAQAFEHFGRRMSGRDPQTAEGQEAFEDEIRSIVNAGLREGLLEEDAREMIEGVIELGDVDVADIMTPRSRVDAIDAAWDWDQVLDFVVRVKRTRIPVYRDTLDNVVGVLYVKDLLSHVAKGRIAAPLESLLRETWKIPAKKKVDDLLHEFLENRHHIAIVLDEYDATRGVVTIEDALELIVGDIHDEHESDAAALIPPWHGGETEVDASAHLDDLAETLGIRFPKDVESDTIAGLFIEQLGRIPKQGESIAWNGVSLTVAVSDRRRIQRIRLRRQEYVAPTAAAKDDGELKV